MLPHVCPCSVVRVHSDLKQLVALCTRFSYTLHKFEPHVLRNERAGRPAVKGAQYSCPPIDLDGCAALFFWFSQKDVDYDPDATGQTEISHVGARSVRHSGDHGERAQSPRQTHLRAPAAGRMAPVRGAAGCGSRRMQGLARKWTARWGSPHHTRPGLGYRQKRQRPSVQLGRCQQPKRKLSIHDCTGNFSETQQPATDGTVPTPPPGPRLLPCCCAAWYRQVLRTPQAVPCPICGHRPTSPLDGPYDPTRSALLDTVLLLEAVVQDLKSVLEEGSA